MEMDTIPGCIERSTDDGEREGEIACARTPHSPSPVIFPKEGAARKLLGPSQGSAGAKWSVGPGVAWRSRGSLGLFPMENLGALGARSQS